MEKFLDELKRALEDSQVENQEEILATYEEHFALGHEAGMTDEEIIERFDSIDEIVSKLSQKKSSNKNASCYDVVLDLSCFEEFYIKKTEASGICFDLDEEALDYVEILRKGNHLELKKKKSFVSYPNKKKFEGTMLVGPNVSFRDFVIKSIYTDLHCNLAIECVNFSLTNVNGDFGKISVIAEKTTTIHNTTGDLSFTILNAPKFTLSNVSGDIEIEDLTSEMNEISTVSGDIDIRNATEAEYRIKSVSGDVTIHKGGNVDLIKSTTISGSIRVNGKDVSKTLSERLKNSFKW